MTERHPTIPRNDDPDFKAHLASCADDDLRAESGGRFCMGCDPELTELAEHYRTLATEADARVDAGEGKPARIDSMRYGRLANHYEAEQGDLRDHEAYAAFSGDLRNSSDY